MVSFKLLPLYNPPTPRERAPGTHWIGDWASPRAVLDAVVMLPCYLFLFGRCAEVSIKGPSLDYILGQYMSNKYNLLYKSWAHRPKTKKKKKKKNE
jgi:hypothetical protein